MPYDYKRKQDCRQSDNKKGTYVTKKKGASSQKCWKSQRAFEKSQAARHAQMEADSADTSVNILDDEEEQITERLVRKIIQRILQHKSKCYK